MAQGARQGLATGSSAKSQQLCRNFDIAMYRIGIGANLVTRFNDAFRLCGVYPGELHRQGDTQAKTTFSIRANSYICSN